MPSPQIRWCTDALKIRPFEKYVGKDKVYNYVGLRADENRKGYLSHKKNIIPVYPFKENNIPKDDIMKLLYQSGLGLPSYYNWRSRSGCYFCFFQQKIEWVGLLENHPDLFEKAMKYEILSDNIGCRYTWSEGESLIELSSPRRIAEIKNQHY